jgi:hypothetical protein
MAPANFEIVDPPVTIRIEREPMPPPQDEPFAPPAIPPEELSGYEISGLPFNMAKIAARKDVLFVFLTGDLGFLDRIAGDLRAEAGRLGNPLDPRDAAPPLVMGEALRQQLLDESWSRRDRWLRFKPIAALLNGHDAHVGEAPALVRGYLDQNLLQPYCDGKTRDGQFWALLENAADHVDFLEFIRGYARTRSSSRTTTELLFLADELAQAGREAAHVVLNTDIGRDLLHTAVNSPLAIRLANEVAADLRAWFASQGMRAERDYGAAYDQVRLRILSTIVETTPGGYRESDARFLAGEIFYKQRQLEQAVEWWSAMRPAGGDTYAAAATAIRSAIRRAPSVDEPAIRTALGTEAARWHEVNYERLKQFGYRCDSY